MKSKGESKEFRSVRAARAALEAYVASGRDLSVLRVIPTGPIDRYDVWQCVFENEREAYAVLEDKEAHLQFLKDFMADPSEGVRSSVGVLAITILTQKVEFKTPLPLKDLLAIIVDCLGEDFIPILKAEAAHSLETRIKICEPYAKADSEWVGYARQVKELVDAL